MKLNKIFAASMLAIAAIFASCGTTPIPDKPDPGNNPEPEVVVKPADTITIAQALEIANALEPSAKTDVEYYIVATLSRVITASDKIAEYGNINIEVKDETGTLGCYYTNNIGNVKFTAASEVPNVGSVIAIQGKLKNYVNKNTGASTPEMENGYIVEVIKEGDGGGELITDAEVVTIAEAIEKAKAGDKGKYKVTAEVIAIKTDAANVPSKYTNINMTIKDETGSIDCYYTNYIDNKPFTSADQIPPIGTKLVIVGGLTLYNNTTPEFLNGYIEEIIEIGEGEKPLEGDVTIKFNKDLGDWTFSATAEYYGNGGLKLNKEGLALTSPAFEPATVVEVTFTIGAFNAKSGGEGANGTDGNNFKVEALNAAGEVVATEELKTSSVDTYTVTLQGAEITNIRLTMVSFPYNGTAYCNVNLASVVINRVN